MTIWRKTNFLSNVQSVILLGLLVLTAAQVRAAQPQGAVAVITEIRLNEGDIQISVDRRGVVERPSVLQSLYPGTRIEASKDASIVILFTMEMKTITVDAKNSPFEIKAVAGKGGQLSTRLGEIVSLLFGAKKPRESAPLLVRGEAILLTPRNTKLMTYSPTFQWMRTSTNPVAVKVYGPDGILWSAKNVTVNEIKYPSSAPKLNAGVDYFWTVEEEGISLEKADFRIITPAELHLVQEKTALLNVSEGLSKNTLSILKASLLASNELFHDAREILLEAVRGDPREPTLHFLLAQIYENTGLGALAAEQYREAERLLTDAPKLK